MDAASQVAQLLEGEAGLLTRAVYELGGPGVALGQSLLGHAQRERKGHQALLGAVVQVALDAPALGVACLDDPRARVAQAGHLGGERRIGVRAEQYL